MIHSFRSYRELCQYLFDLHSIGNMKYTLNLMRKFASLLGFSPSTYPTVHVAGTNGKGSVSWKVAKALELAGYRVGLYTSPHLERIEERVRVNGQLMPEALFVERVTELLKLAAREGDRITFFELMTLTAFSYFMESRVDLAIIEAGVGGRIDSTNIISPILSIVTSIGWDHSDILGGTIEAIAEQKAGVIKPGVPAVLGPSARHPALFARAKEVNAPLLVNEGEFVFFDDENSATARLALEELKNKFTLPEEAIKEGLAARPPCRFEESEGVIYDVAHNNDGICSLMAAVERYFPSRPFCVVCGFAKDKELKECLGLLAARAERLYLVKAPTPKEGAPAEELGRVLQEQGFTHFEQHAQIGEAITAALESGLLVVVCGSFYLMKEAKAAHLRFIAQEREAPLACQGHARRQL